MERTMHSVAELVDEAMLFKPEIVVAAKAMARSKPWRGTLDERKQKFTAAAKTLGDLIDGPEGTAAGAPRLIFGVLDGSDSISSNVGRRNNRISLVGRLSVVTLFWTLAARAGMGGRDSMKFAINLFRVAFPHSFARCDLSGPFVRNNQRLSSN